MTTETETEADDDDDRKKPDKPGGQGHGKPDHAGGQGGQGQKWSVNLGPDLGARAKASAEAAGEGDWKDHVILLVDKALADEAAPESAPEPV